MTKKTTRTFQGKSFPSSASRAGRPVYKTDATVCTTKTTATGMSFSGKSISSNGIARAAAASSPALSTFVEHPIGGGLAMSQTDFWRDNGLNQRASVDLWAAAGSLITGDLDVRVSKKCPAVLVITLEMSAAFTNVDEKLEYLLDRINEAYNCNGDRNACLRILQNHARYISAKMNLKDLLGEERTSYLVEHRITAPFVIDDCLVTQEEDAIFFGYCVVEDDDTGETHIHFELKQKGKFFEPVTIDGLASGGHTPAGKKSMFNGGATRTSGSAGMDSIPENITFASPHHGNDDDGSTIKTEPTRARGSVFRKPPPPPHAAAAKANLNAMDVDDDEETYEYDPDWDKASSDSGRSKEVEDLRKQLEELKGIVSGIAQSRSRDSADSTPSTAASTAKKNKNNNGSASSVAGASRRSDYTRGSARSVVRKKSVSNPSANFFFNPGKKAD